MSGPAVPATLAEPAFLDLPDGRRMRYRLDAPCAGGTAADVVLMLHGIGCSLEDFDDQHALLRQRYRCLSVDLAGFGRSDRPAEPMSLVALARSALDVLDALGLTAPVHVVGNSLGGAVAMQLAAQAPERVRDLVLLDPAGFGRTVTWALRVLAVRPLGRRLLVPSLEATRRAQRGIFADPALVTEERVRRAHELSLRPHGTEVMVETADALGTFWGVRPGWRRRLVRALARTDLPVLVVWGERDRILPATHVRAVRRSLPRAQVHVLAGTGHMPQVERPERVAELAQRFWEGCAP
ncbi:pimeloyl-ACP methyl ester carboxylesterase [Kineococcus xinjiangensis]|uniref:Pimeloyl-ACP methyl ester carboxylesterase n=1 Tax=Kineococcus xinjiangensis TaxID=512762 RepID=A0A2S6IDC6_9ACTN|nr:alpha/beta fold hydrolase [Kineococcus xinjiangensis]PPK92196.1 pimeloyl-ACP methyl ester carboxylesterase [Kineococcus xinjiangensis]